MSHMEPLRILVPVNGDVSDEQAVRLACGLTKKNKNKGKVFVLNVVEVGRNLPVESPEPDEVDRCESILHRMESVGAEEKCAVEAEILQAREAGPAVVAEALERGADLIIMGVDYKKRHGEFRLGDTIEYVLKNAPCRVLISREPATNGTGRGGSPEPASVSAAGAS